MADKSPIEWTDATWNLFVGCSVVSPGCKNCYAMRTAWRLGHNPQTPQYAGLTEKVNGKPVFNGKVNFVEHLLLKPLRWRTPKMIFVNSMSDLFHENIPDEQIDKAFAVMARCPHHFFQILTKRPERMRDYMIRPGRGYDGKWIESPGMGARDGIRRELVRMGLYFGLDDWPLPNVWLGTSVEDQKRADERSRSCSTRRRRCGGSAWSRCWGRWIWTAACLMNVSAGGLIILIGSWPARRAARMLGRVILIGYAAFAISAWLPAFPSFGNSMS